MIRLAATRLALLCACLPACTGAPRDDDSAPGRAGDVDAALVARGDAVDAPAAGAVDAPAARAEAERGAALARASAPGGATVASVARESLGGDVYHETFTFTLDARPNAKLRLHRVVREKAPWVPRATRGGAMLMHGDFSSFAGNFAPSVNAPGGAEGLAVWLAREGFDVWGLDRRWATTPADGDLSDFDAMSVAQELDDVGLALASARALRLASGAGADRLHLLGFSRGGYLAYAYAALEGARPAWQRHVKGLVPLDMWAEIAPDDAAARAATCETAAFERDALAQGFVDSENGFFIELGQLALSAPEATSPFTFFGDVTNRGAFLITAAQTYSFFFPTPRYHLAASAIVDGAPTGLTESSETTIAQWFAHAVPHQSMRESAESDGAQCGDGQGPPGSDLSRISVPLFYVGAAGGYGTHGLYSTIRVASTDVSTLVVQRFG
ncbi:MAG TPA: hypothetical protein VFS00_20760, partial [Polyangiaceae bacterium]|nr:hypothetical protein [Polyangiaceae bacterium]